METGLIGFLITLVALLSLTVWKHGLFSGRHSFQTRATSPNSSQDSEFQTAPKRRTTKADLAKQRFVVQCIVSLASLALAVYLIISSKDGSKSREWAFGTIGMMLGFWMK